MAERFLRTLTFPNLGTYQIQDYNILPRKSLPSAPIHAFSDGADNIPIKAMSVAVRAVQSGSGDPSPDNVRPISGWSSAKIYATGKNLLDPSTLGMYDATGTGTMRYGFGAIWLKAGKYTINRQSGSTNMYVTNITDGYTSDAVSPYPYTFELTHDSAIMVRTALLDGSTYNNVGVQLEVGETATAYEPYVGNIATIDFNGTVYGGTLEYVGGKEWRFTPTHAIVNLGGPSWGKTVNNFFFFAGPANMFLTDVTESNRQFGIGVCDTYGFVQTSIDNAPDGSITMYYDNTLSAYRTFVRDGAKANLTGIEFKEAMDGVMLWYELAEASRPGPITLYADADVVTQYADNVMYADCGDSSLTYRQDIGLILEE